MKKTDNIFTFIMLTSCIILIGARLMYGEFHIFGIWYLCTAVSDIVVMILYGIHSGICNNKKNGTIFPYRN